MGLSSDSDDSESMLFSELTAASVQQIPGCTCFKSKRECSIFLYLETRLDEGGINRVILSVVC